MNDDLDSIQDTRRSSFSQNSFFVGSPKDSLSNVSKWIGDSRKLFTNIIKTKPQETQQVEDFNNVFYPRRARTQSVSSDISVEEQPTGERRSSFSERYFGLQVIF